jgi:hypothetical protein
MHINKNFEGTRLQVSNFERHCWQMLDGTFAELDFPQMADAGRQLI